MSVGEILDIVMIASASLMILAIHCKLVARHWALALAPVVSYLQLAVA